MSAGFRPIAITGTAAVTAVGASAAQSCGAIRAGLRGLREHPCYDPEPGPEGDPGRPLVAGSVPGLDASLAGPGRLLALLVPVLAALAKSARLRRADVDRCALLVALPEPDDGVAAWDLAGGFVPELCRRAGIEPPVTRLSFAGRAAGLELFAAASEILARREADACIVAGVDSYLSEDRLIALDRAQRIKSARNVDGFVPGEAASALLLESPRRAESRRATVSALIAGVGTATEPEPIRSDRASTGRGLSAAVRAAAPAGSGWVLCDLNGESYRAFEWGVVLARLGERLGGVERLVLPVLSTGDIGAATAGVLAACVAAAFERGYAPADEALVWASSDEGLRCAARITRA